MKKNILALFLVGFLLAPAFSFAQVVGDVDPNPTISSCITLDNNLRYKDRDVNNSGEILTLQDFLQSKNYLNSEPTGYFGLLTFKAIKDFQKDNNISPTGYVGLITKAKIKALSCDGTISTTSNNPVISGVSGPQKLDINQTGTWTVSASSSTGGNLSYYVVWGDEGNTYPIASLMPRYDNTQQTGTFTHSYSKVGIYTPTFTVTSENTIRCITTPCLSNEGSAKTSLSVNVGNTVSANHNPVINPIAIPSYIEVGKSVNFTFSATDVDNDNLCWTMVNWGDNITQAMTCSTTINPVVQNGRGWTFNTNHTWNTEGTYNVKVTVSDQKGGSASSNFSVNVDHLYVINSTDNKNDNQELSCKKITITLKKGIEDNQVKCLQEMLIAKGFKIEGIEKGKETTFFGPKTLSALKEFQTKNQLKADGIFGPSSREVLEKMEQE